MSGGKDTHKYEIHPVLHNGFCLHVLNGKGPSLAIPDCFVDPVVEFCEFVDVVLFSHGLPVVPDFCTMGEDVTPVCLGGKR